MCECVFVCVCGCGFVWKGLLRDKWERTLRNGLDHYSSTRSFRCFLCLSLQFSFSFASCYMRMRHVTCKWVTSHMDESCHIWVSHVLYKWIMLHVNESRQIWMSIVSMNESFPYEWVMSHTLCDTQACVCQRINTILVSFLYFPRWTGKKNDRKYFLSFFFSFLLI